ncbi:dephospho-CoA kinase [Nocardia mangyaensis]|uniref:Dephospho-CoA kinase n=1 Tax=Nocardia mangyaensis TaxID=2213200 RepID=A0A1J0VQB7_9NOCA|nr:dephospho-CoA kinase [Nocardia mangyaensis]APE34202.1 dephospho-CoA kinase [Nocardia mangyaensis]
MLRIGLTGGMGAGKSTVARSLVELGAVLIDSDVIAREVVAPGTPGLAALVEAFGTQILAEDGSLDRPALAAVAFADDEARGTLNAITHPLVGARTTELIGAAAPDAIVVQDIPLLVENGLAPLMQLVVVVGAEEQTRLRRLVEQRGVAEADAKARIAAQATDEQRRAVADVWLDNNGAPGEVEERVRALWEQRIVPFERNAREGVRARADYRLVPHEHEWAVQARRIIARLHLACGAAAVRIDHVGSTAVSGLPAKDVLDIQVTVADLATAESLADPLAAAGFPVAPGITHDNPKPTAADPAGTDLALWGKRLHGNADPARPANIHLRVQGSPGQRFALDLRDWLRSEEGARAEYLAVKREAERAAADKAEEAAGAAYYAVKEPWFDAVHPRVTEWARARA